MNYCISDNCTVLQNFSMYTFIFIYIYNLYITSTTVDGNVSETMLTTVHITYDTQFHIIIFNYFQFTEHAKLAYVHTNINWKQISPGATLVVAMR